jgi:hypothetical protein
LKLVTNPTARRLKCLHDPPVASNPTAPAFSEFIGERRSLRKIAAELAAMGHLNERGAPFSAERVRAMLAQ